MKVVVAPDKFAGTLSAVDAASAIRDGWHDVSPTTDVVCHPMADGGPGFLGVLANAIGVRPTPVVSTDALGAATTAQLLVDVTSGTAYIESAQVCSVADRDAAPQPLVASTSGLVPLLEAALDTGVATIVVGVGGTASTDGGRPVVELLAGRIPPGVELIAATDVENPLLGPAGAARSFGPQKGASDVDVVALEQRLAAWASGGDLDPSTAGAGAGGGLGYGLMRLGARRVSGAEVVATLTGLRDAVAGSRLVVTGEGRLDFSSLAGKVVTFVASCAVQRSVPCVVVAGSSTVGRREAAVAGIDEIVTLEESVGLTRAMADAQDAARRTAARLARQWVR